MEAIDEGLGPSLPIFRRFAGDGNGAGAAGACGTRRPGMAGAAPTGGLGGADGGGGAEPTSGL